MRGISGELNIYKKRYKALGYTHAPTAAGYYLTGPAWVQIKTLKNPEAAVGAMKKAIDKLVRLSPGTPTPLKLHILKKPGASSTQLKSALNNYIDQLGNAVSSGFTLEIEAFELSLCPCI